MSDMQDVQGSYQFDGFGDDIQHQEFNRLSHQANILLPLEKRLWSQLNLRPGDQVLDLGCGPGVITQAIAEHVYPGEVVGVDVSATLIQTVQQFSSLNGHRCPRSVTFQVGDAYNLDWPDESFDVVYARLLFQHLAEPLKALASVLRVLRRGGHVCILDVDDDWASVHPEPEAFSRLRQEIVNRQHARGGDPWVGRKLAPYLKAAGFIQVQTRIHLIESNDLGLATFFDLLSLGAPYRSGPSDLDEAIAEAHHDIQILIKNPSAWAGLGLFVVTGQKPS
jgi:ubiquinone/menaquinone biosynthesis C-methylase UbiE